MSQKREFCQGGGGRRWHASCHWTTAEAYCGPWKARLHQDRGPPALQRIIQSMLLRFRCVSSCVACTESSQKTRQGTVTPRLNDFCMTWNYVSAQGAASLRVAEAGVVSSLGFQQGFQSIQDEVKRKSSANPMLDMRKKSSASGCASPCLGATKCPYLTAQVVEEPLTGLFSYESKERKLDRKHFRLEWNIPCLGRRSLQFTNNWGHCGRSAVTEPKGQEMSSKKLRAKVVRLEGQHGAASEIPARRHSRSSSLSHNVFLSGVCLCITV